MVPPFERAFEGQRDQNARRDEAQMDQGLLDRENGVMWCVDFHGRAFYLVVRLSRESRCAA